MVATPISPTTRYYAVGTRKFYWVTTISNKAAPSRGELNAGIDLSGEVAIVDGFTKASDTVDAPDYGTRFVSTIPGRIKADNSKLTMYATANSADVRAIITQDTNAFVVIFPEGDVAGRKMDVWPMRVLSVSKPTSDGDPAQIVIEFAPTSEPAMDVTVP